MPFEARNNAITLANKGLLRDPRGPYRDWEDEVYVGIVYEAMKEEGTAGRLVVRRNGVSRACFTSMQDRMWSRHLSAYTVPSRDAESLDARSCM